MITFRAVGLYFNWDHLGSPQAKVMTRAITYYLAKDAVPLNTVEKPGFKHDYGVQT